MVGRVSYKGGCWSMDMGGRLEDLEIDVFFFSLCFPMAGSLSSVRREWRGIQGGGGDFFSSQVWWCKGWGDWFS